MWVAVSDWKAIALFAALILALAVYGLAASGHFPSEHRRATLRGPIGTAVLWGSMVVAVMATVAAARFAWVGLPAYAAVIAGGGALLFAPLLLIPLPDHIVDGKAGLLLFATIAAGLALISAGF